MLPWLSWSEDWNYHKCLLSCSLFLSSLHHLWNTSIFLLCWTIYALNMHLKSCNAHIWRFMRCLKLVVYCSFSICCCNWWFGHVWFRSDDWYDEIWFRCCWHSNSQLMSDWLTCMLHHIYSYTETLCCWLVHNARNWETSFAPHLYQTHSCGPFGWKPGKTGIS